MKYLHQLVIVFICCFINSHAQDSELKLVLGGSVELTNQIQSTDIVDNLDNGLYLNILIDSKTYKFLIDTGAFLSVISDDILSVKNSDKKITVQDLHGNETEKDIYLLDFNIGENLFKNFAFIKQDLSYLVNNSCNKFDGIIGVNILKKLNWKLLINEKKIYFSKTKFNYENFNNPIEVNWYNNLTPLIKLNIDTFEFIAALDTGYYGTVKLSEDVYKSNFKNFKSLEKGIGFPVISFFGKIETELRKTKLNSLSIGKGLNFKDFEIYIDQSKPLIGNKFLFSDDLILNFLNDEIAFGKHINEKKLENSNLNIKICKSEQNKNEIELCFFWTNDLNKNLKVGDKIIKIDIFNTENVTDLLYCELLNYIKNKSSINVTLKRKNKEFTAVINLANYKN